jgi:hypothetical protein
MQRPWWRAAFAAAGLSLVGPLAAGCDAHGGATAVPIASGAAKGSHDAVASAGGYCTGNSADITGQTVDCYVPYASTTTLNWNIVGNTAPDDLDDPNGVDPGGNGLLCGGGPVTATVSGAHASSVTANATQPALPSCGAGYAASAPLTVTVVTNADPDAGPFTVAANFAAPVTLWDPSDFDGDPGEADFVMVLHVGTCAPGSAPAAAAHVAASARHASRHRTSSAARRPRVGAIGNLTAVYGLPVLGGPPPACFAAPPPSPPTPAPRPTPPAPSIPKTMYTASLISQPRLPLTDAASAEYGALTWHVAGDVDKFQNVAFAPAATAGPPHADTLGFDVPPTVPPNDYTVRVSVTSSSFGTTSAETVVTLRVLPPVLSGTSDNALQVFQQDNAGNVIVSDGSDIATTNGDTTEPDFGLVQSAAGTASARRAAQAVSTIASYDALKPPAGLAAELATREKQKIFTCGGLLTNDNLARDATSGSSQGTLVFFAYCNAPVANLAFHWTTDAMDLNSLTLIQSADHAPVPCSYTGQKYGNWLICATQGTPIVPVSGHAEEDRFRYDLIMLQPASRTLSMAESGGFVINNKGVFYPKVPASPAWGQTSNGVVPFPPPGSNIHRCPDVKPPLPGCYNASNNSARLGKSLRDAGFAKPGGRFEAHHILPTSFGGDDTATNGVWLPGDPQHQQFSTWWNIFNFSL